MTAVSARGARPRFSLSESSSTFSHEFHQLLDREFRQCTSMHLQAIELVFKALFVYMLYLKRLAGYSFRLIINTVGIDENWKYKEGDAGLIIIVVVQIDLTLEESP